MTTNVMLRKIEPTRAGLRCEVQVINGQGHGVLTTYEPGVDNSVEIAQAELVAFFDECITSFRGGGGGGLEPQTFGRTADMAEDESAIIDVADPEFDLSLFEQVTIMPGPLAGG